MGSLLVIQHVPHERLGTFEPAFKSAGCSLAFLNSYDPKAVWPPVAECDGVITMGGPQSVYEQDTYPYLTRELEWLRDALKAHRPILGVCLGAQVLASALGARVTKNPQKEIGWFPLMREPDADGDPLFSAFGETETVFQWHGDTFVLPTGSVRLASSPLCHEQAFRYRDNVYGLQCHVEVTEAMVRAWMQTPVNKRELARLRGVIDPMAIRRRSAQYVGRLQELAHHVATVFAKRVTAQAQTDSRGERPRASSHKPRPTHRRSQEVHTYDRGD